MITLVLQYHQADRQQADALARFIADLEPTKRHDVRIRLVAKNCPHLDADTIHALAQKFDVSWTKAETKIEGWPAGPNALAVEILTTAPHWLNECGWNDCCGVLMLEPDCVPLSAGWLNQLINAWSFALLDGAWVMGSWRNSGGPYGHVNGVAIYRTDFGKKAELRKCPINFAWDCWTAPHTREHWSKSGLFLNRFQSTNATEEILRTPEIGSMPPVLVHGFRDTSAMEIARRWCLTSV